MLYASSFRMKYLLLAWNATAYFVKQSSVNATAIFNLFTICGGQFSNLDSNKAFKVGLDLNSFRMLVNNLSSSNESTAKNKLECSSDFTTNFFEATPASETN